MMHVRAYGPPDTRCSTLVFLHGGGISGWMWEGVVEYLDSEYHCLVPDLPEQGETTLEDAGPFSIANAAMQVAALIEERAHGGMTHVVGLSLGAQVVVQLLGTVPAHLRRAVVSSALVRPLPASALITGLARLTAPFKGVTPFMEANRRGAGVPERYRDEFYRDARGISCAGLVRVLQENARFRPPPGLETAETPTLVVVGERELALMRRSALDLVRILPHAEGRTAVGQQHAWPLQKPHLFAAMVRAWVENEPLPTVLAPLV